MDKRDLKLLLLVSGGVVLGNIFLQFCPYVFGLPLYWWGKFKFHRGRKVYHELLSNGNKSGRNILFMFHGPNMKTPFLPHVDLIDYEKDNVIFIDKDPKINPHYVIDLSQPGCLSQFENESIDIIVAHLCTCHCKAVIETPEFANECKRVLKKRTEGGELWSGMECTFEGFKYDRKIRSESNLLLPKSPNYIDLVRKFLPKYPGDSSFIWEDSTYIPAYDLHVYLPNDDDIISE